MMCTGRGVLKMTKESLGKSDDLIRVKINIDKFAGEPTNFSSDGKNKAWFDNGVGSD